MSKHRLLIAALALVTLATVPAAAQRGKFEVVPEVGYTFGGGFDIDAGVYNGVAYPGGKLELDASPSYGATLGFETKRGTYFTVSYVYQGTEIGVNWNSTPPSIEGVDPNRKGDITLHKVLFGGRQEFYKSSEQKLRPYIGGGLGFVVADPNFETAGGASISSETRFLLSLNGGLRYMFGEEKRFGLQADMKGTWFWVPNGDVYLWCDYWYGCSAYEGSATIAQGTASLGAVIKF
jgi:hypothetical protein